MADQFIATVVIVTFNRKDDLRNAVASALSQTGGVEVLVLDDGSTDGTAEMMRDEFPQARYDLSDKNMGHIAHRNRASDLAQSPILISIDDDATFSSPHVVEQTVRDFDDPRIGSVAIPYIDVKVSDKLLQTPPDDEQRWAAAVFRGTAYAMRRDVFDQTGRFREVFRHSAEEEDFCLRMMDGGHTVRIGRADAIHHFESPQRIRSYKFERAARNIMINLVLNYPLSVLPIQIAGKSLNFLKSGAKQGMLFYAIRGILRGLGYGVAHIAQRRAVARQAFDKWQRLRKEKMILLDEVLPPA